LSLWVLDTDVLSLWLRGQETIGAHVDATPPQQLAVTIITKKEVLGGWYTQIRQACDDQQLPRAYQAFHKAIEFSHSVRILPFDLLGIRCYRRLWTQHRRIGANDLYIAAIVLAQEGIPMTRNANLSTG
jgi:tRNA(fMet)-specific endonuclease VapC